MNKGWGGPLDCQSCGLPDMPVTLSVTLPDMPVTLSVTLPDMPVTLPVTLPDMPVSKIVIHLSHKVSPRYEAGAVAGNPLLPGSPARRQAIALIVFKSSRVRKFQILHPCFGR